jgi:hypothetical protein
VEVSVNLAVRSQEARVQALEGGADVSFVVEMSLEFEVEHFHGCITSPRGRQEVFLVSTTDCVVSHPTRATRGRMQADWRDKFIIALLPTNENEISNPMERHPA